MKIKRVLFSLGLLTVFLGGCTAGSGTDADDTASSDYASSLAVLGEMLSGTTPTVARDFRTMDSRGTDCSTLSYGSCDTPSMSRTRSFSTSGGDSSGCSRGEISVFGQAILTFSNGSCAFTAASSTLTRTFKNHYYKDSSGRNILIYSGTGATGGKTIAAADLKDFTGTTRAGGSVVTKGSGSTDTLVINGIHRRAVKPGGNYGFWHTLFTSSPINITRGIATSTIASGEFTLFHNRASITVTNTMDSLVFNTSCCYPVSGSVVHTLTTSSNATSSVTTTFSSPCGSASIGGDAVTLPTCGN